MATAEPKLPSQLPITQPRHVGKDSARMEDPLLLTGKVEYGNDIRTPGMLHAAILRSPHAHARIKSIDTSRAEKLPGVAAVLTGKEVKDWSRPVFGVPEGWTGYALAVGKTHWVGEPVAVIAASDRYIADWNPFNGMLTLRGGHRSPHLILPALVISLGISSQQVRIIQSPLGGSFGVKTFARYVVLIALMAKKLGGRPVKWTEDRIEHLIGNSSHAWDRHYDCELALKGDGTIAGMKMQLVDDLGAFSEWLAIGMLLKPLLCLGSCYHIANVDYSCKGVITNKTPQGPLRAFGLPPHFWVIEQLIEIAAKKLGLESNEVRRRNFIKKDQFPYVSPSGNVYNSGDDR